MGEPAVELRAAWLGHVATETGALERLLARHREAHRRYHGVDHVAWVLRHVEELAGEEPLDDHGAVVAAAFYHDAVYTPGDPENERASAQLARRDLAELGWDDARAERVAEMIEATATHLADDGPEGVDHDRDVLLDADLAVLAADAAAYRDYAAGVRGEHAHLEDATWLAGRRAVVEHLLGREQIYATTTGRRRWERHARANLAAELASLAR